MIMFSHWWHLPSSSSSSLHFHTHNVHIVASYVKTCSHNSHCMWEGLGIDVHSITQRPVWVQNRKSHDRCTTQYAQYAKFWNLATSSHSHGVKMATKSHRLFMLVLILPTIFSISCIEIYKTLFRKGEFVTFGICRSYAEATQLCCYWQICLVRKPHSMLA